MTTESEGDQTFTALTSGGQKTDPPNKNDNSQKATILSPTKKRNASSLADLLDDSEQEKVHFSPSPTRKRVGVGVEANKKANRDQISDDDADLFRPITRRQTPSGGKVKREDVEESTKKESAKKVRSSKKNDRLISSSSSDIEESRTKNRRRLFTDSDESEDESDDADIQRLPEQPLVNS